MLEQHHCTEGEDGSSVEDKEEATPKNAARMQRARRHRSSAKERKQAATSQGALKGC